MCGTSNAAGDSSKNSPVVFTTGLLILDRLKIEVELL